LPTFFRAVRPWAAAIGLALLPAATPASAEPLPDPTRIATPRERAAVERLMALITAGESARASRLAELDLLLASLPEPTALRGYAQFLRTVALLAADRDREARAAIEESIRLLPAYSGPLLLAAQIEAFGDRPGSGADYLLRAASIDPEIVRDAPDFELSALIGRLRQHDEDRRLLRLAERLFEIGWQGEDLDLRSSLAADLIRARLGSGDLAGARAALPNLVAPDDARRLLIATAYRPLWPAIEEWVGPLQRRQWQVYLTEVGARWRASGDPSHGASYARALARAGHDETLVREMLPVLMARLDAQNDYFLLWAVASVAAALARMGRWDEADALFAHMLLTWPLGSDANALNLVANRARTRLLRGDAAAALSMIDAAIADAGRYQGQVSIAPLGAMHVVRACALHRLGRGAEALRSVAIAAAGTSVDGVVNMYVCMGRPEAARTVLVDRLAREEMRAQVAEFVQIDDDRPAQSEFARFLHAGREALRGDPTILERVRPHARVLHYSARAGVPSEAAAR
jgi:hypothetical protein